MLISILKITVSAQVLFSEHHQKKIKNYLQIGNELHLNYNSKSDDSFGYFKVEILKVNTPIFFSQKRSMYCINAALNLVKLLTVENQENTSIYELVHKLSLIHI